MNFSFGLSRSVPVSLDAGRVSSHGCLILGVAAAVRGHSLQCEGGRVRLSPRVESSEV